MCKRMILALLALVLSGILVGCNKTKYETVEPNANYSYPSWMYIPPTDAYVEEEWMDATTVAPSETGRTTLPTVSVGTTTTTADASAVSTTGTAAPTVPTVGLIETTATSAATTAAGKPSPATTAPPKPTVPTTTPSQPTTQTATVETTVSTTTETTTAAPTTSSTTEATTTTATTAPAVDERVFPQAGDKPHEYLEFIEVSVEGNNVTLVIKNVTSRFESNQYDYMSFICYDKEGIELGRVEMNSGRIMPGASVTKTFSIPDGTHQVVFEKYEGEFWTTGWV